MSPLHPNMEEKIDRASYFKRLSFNLFKYPAKEMYHQFLASQISLASYLAHMDKFYWRVWELA